MVRTDHPKREKGSRFGIPLHSHPHLNVQMIMVELSAVEQPSLDPPVGVLVFLFVCEK